MKPFLVLPLRKSVDAQIATLMSVTILGAPVKKVGLHMYGCMCAYCMYLHLKLHVTVLLRTRLPACPHHQ